MENETQPSAPTGTLAATYAAARSALKVKTRGAGATGSYKVLLAKVKDAGLLGRTRGFYFRKVGLTLLAIAGVWSALVLTGGSWWVVALAALGLGVLTTQLAFVGHEAAHRQVFSSSKANKWASILLADVGAGLSIGWWNNKHTRHHGAPNQSGKDPDVKMKVLSFTEADVAERSRLGRALTRRQGWYFFALLPFTAFSFILNSYKALLDPKRGVEHRFVELGLLTARLAGFGLLSLLVLPPAQAAVLVLVQMLVFGAYMAGTFALNHMGMPVLPAGSKVDFLQRQVLTTRNIRGGWFMSWLMGGLNHQVEHHLFPSMPRPHLRRARELVMAHCREEGIPYHEEGFFSSYSLVVKYLDVVGMRGSDPLECPLASRLRLAAPAPTPSLA
jgi:fatty acid desaturase